MSESRPRSGPSARVCYLSIDGMTDPLGRSQVLPYLTALAGMGHDITIISLEKAGRFETGRAAVAALCDRTGIVWKPLRYWAKPPVLAGRLNVSRMAAKAWSLHRQRPFDIVHARSDLPSLAGERLWRRGGAKFLYDMRALWPDERVEGGAWPQSRWLYRRIFRYFKRLQRQFLDEADAIVTLTERGKALVESWPGRTGNAPVTVIPCCADFDLFQLPDADLRQRTREALGVSSGTRVVTYVGSVGSWYMLPEMLDFFRVYRQRYPDAKLLFVTPDGEQPIRDKAVKAGVDDALIVRSARREEMPSFLAAADLGLFFIMPVFSKQASSPTKMGEMLASGLPIICNDGVGDVGDMVRETAGGVLIDRFEETAYREAVDRLDSFTHAPADVRRKARRWFDVEMGGAAYARIYAKLLKEKARQ